MFEIWDKALKNPKFTTEYMYNNNHFYLSHADCASIRRLSQSNSKSGARISLIKKKREKKSSKCCDKNLYMWQFSQTKSKEKITLNKDFKSHFWMSGDE